MVFQRDSRLQDIFFFSFQSQTLPIFVVAAPDPLLSWTIWEGSQTWDDVFLDSLQLISVTHVVKHSFKAEFQKPCSTWRVGATAALELNNMLYIIAFVDCWTAVTC